MSDPTLGRPRVPRPFVIERKRLEHTPGGPQLVAEYLAPGGVWSPPRWTTLGWAHSFGTMREAFVALTHLSGDPDELWSLAIRSHREVLLEARRAGGERTPLEHLERVEEQLDVLWATVPPEAGAVIDLNGQRDQLLTEAETALRSAIDSAVSLGLSVQHAEHVERLLSRLRLDASQGGIQRLDVERTDMAGNLEGYASWIDEEIQQARTDWTAAS